MVGTRLAELRKEANLSQQDLATQLNVSLSAVSAYERDVSDPDDDTKVHIAKLFNVSLDWLMGAVDKRRPLTPRKVIYLPDGFPDASVDEAKNFVNYLIQINKEKENG